MGEDLRKYIGPPFAHFLEFFGETASFAHHLHVVWFSELCLIIIFTTAVARSFRRATNRVLEKLSWLLYFVLVFSLTRLVWVEDYSFLRAVTELYVIGVMLLLSSRTKLSNLVLAGGCIAWLLLAVDLLFVR